MECALILVKPNDYMQEICAIVETIISKNELEVVKKKELRLTQEQLNSSFTTKADRKQFVEFMLSGNVTAYLVRGENAVTKAKRVKAQIRKIWGRKKNEINNILHSADEGVEYYLQFTVCFPELDIKEYCGYVDFEVNVEEQDDKTLKEIVNESNAITGIVYTDNKIDELKRGRLPSNPKCIWGRKYEFTYGGRSYELIAYAREIIDKNFERLQDMITYVNTLGGFVALKNYSINYFNGSFLEYLKESGVKAAFATPASGSLFLSRNLQEYFESFNFVVLHGGGQNIPPYSITNSKKTLELLMNRVESTDERE